MDLNSGLLLGAGTMAQKIFTELEMAMKHRVIARGRVTPPGGRWREIAGLALALTWSLPTLAQAAPVEAGREIPLGQLGVGPEVFKAAADASGTFTWWLPARADAFVLPSSAGVVVEATNAPLLAWLKEGSPWELTELPAFGVRYSGRTAAVIVPWPHYAELVVGERVGVRFKFPAGRTQATPCEVVAQWRGADPLEVARAFRSWRESATNTGGIPRPNPLSAKAQALPAVTNLFGAPHIYLWGPAWFSRHDVARARWPAAARTLRNSAPDTFAGRLVAKFSAEQRKALDELSVAEWADNYLTSQVAEAIQGALAAPDLLPLPAGAAAGAAAKENSQALAKALAGLANAPETWGDGFSLTLLEALHAAGLKHAVLLLNDFLGSTPRPEVAAAAAKMGFLLGPYDSYHTVHNPEAAPGNTWETAQFDRAAFENGRVLNADGYGSAGFKHTGFHFSPAAAWPYVRNRVNGALAQTPFSAWFVDCDATAECFDDYNPLHPATRADDIHARSERLRWLGAEKKLVVGSEGGSALFADVICFGHGIQTPYLGHLAPEFKDPHSPSFIGKYWPPDEPANSFKAIVVPPSLRSPYFDPRARIPLYRAALGDEVIATHHWSYDSFKFGDVAAERELMELLYMVPPLYHLNRETWPQRRPQIVRHYAFWSPIHEQLAAAPLTQFEVLTANRLLQRTTFRHAAGDVTMTVNFSDEPLLGYPGSSATVAGALKFAQSIYVVAGR